MSARDCAGDIPEELRADALRMLLDRKLLRIDEMPEADRELALSRGRPEAEIPEELRAAVTTQALGYRHCVQSRTRQGR